MKILIGGFILLVLVPVMVRDMREKTIDLRLIIAAMISSAALLIVTGQEVFGASGILGLMPGLALFGMSYLPGEPIGRGDGMVVMWLGYLIGPAAVTEVLVLAWGLAFLAVIPRVMLRKKRRIAFVPFIFISLSCLFFPLVFRMCG